jgi:hypothetical protein
MNGNLKRGKPRFPADVCRAVKQIVTPCIAGEIARSLPTTLEAGERTVVRQLTGLLAKTANA